MPPIHGRSTSGTTIDAICLLVIFQHGDQRARHAQSGAIEGVHQPGSWPTSAGLYLILARRAWKSPTLETDETSSHSPQPGAQTSRS